MTDNSDVNNHHSDQDPDEEFAENLASKFEQMLQNKHLKSAGKSNNPRLDAAMDVLRLIEQFKQAEQKTEFQSTQARHATETNRAATGDVDSNGFSGVPNLDQLGRFEIIEQIGQGGFGVVVRAHDPQLHRDVAIKIPRIQAALNPDSQQRFEKEARAAAALNHPGIVQVYENDVDQGVSFIVYELVVGDDLATLLARTTYPPTEAARLIARTADAVHHAHQRGVLHRDLKPGNILIESSDNGLQPRIADFGLAAISDQLNFTNTGDMIGTPAYMSPEQASAENQTIGPGTDIYALGAVLYELLTGRSPFSGLPILELLPAISRRDPDPPRSINPSIPKDLEAVCLKCLEKKPSDRYVTALELQADLNRFLDGEPVVARRITPLQRSWRRVQQNPIVSLISAACLVLLFISLVTTTWGWISTSRALKREQVAVEETQATVDRYFTDVSENELLDAPGLSPLRQKLLNNALEHYETVVARYRDDPDIAEELAMTYFRIGKIQHELGEYELAIGSFESTRNLLNELNLESSLPLFQSEITRRMGQASAKLGRVDEAKVQYSNAIESQRGLLENSPADSEVRHQLAKSLKSKLVLQNDIGDFAGAVESGDEAISLNLGLLVDSPDDTGYRRELAGVYLNQSNSFAKKGDLPLAIETVEQGILLFRSLSKHRANSVSDLDGLSTALSIRARQHLLQREFESAQILLDEARELNEMSVLFFPQNEEYLKHRLHLSGQLGFCYSATGKPDQAIELIRENISTLQGLMKRSPENRQYQFELGVAQMNLGSTLAQHSDNPDAALAMLRDAEANLTAFIADNPDFFQGAMLFSFCKLNLSAALNESGDYTQALEKADSAIDLMESLAKQKPGVPQIEQNLAGGFFNRAQALENLGRTDEAIKAWRLTVDKGGRQVSKNRLRLAAALAQSDNVGEAEEILNDIESNTEATRQFAKALGLARVAIAKAWAGSGDIKRDQIDGQLDKAIESFRIWLEEPGKSEKRDSRIRELESLDGLELLRERPNFAGLIEQQK